MIKKSKNMKKGVSIAVTAMMTFPLTPIVFATDASATEANNGTSNLFENAASTAKPAKNPKAVYTSLTKSLSSNAGDGSAQNPYNRFEDAIAQVADGGTIYIAAAKGAFLNAQDEFGQKPFLIDKTVTIKPAEGASNANLSVRAGGILLGADVTFENITLSFVNKYHDSIFANGYQLKLINVSRPSGSRNIDLFAGGLYDRDSGLQIHSSGSNGAIHIETTDKFRNTYTSSFGNIYAGSMNGEYKGNAEIRIVNNSRKLEVGAIKASGALEADPGHMFDLVEPAAPLADPNQFATHGDVTIHLQNYQTPIDGTTGSVSRTNVTTSSEYIADLQLKNINHLTVQSGQIAAVTNESDLSPLTIPNVTLLNGATLDLTKAAKVVNVDSYTGDGTIMLSRDGKLNITDSMNGTLNFQTEGAFGGSSGFVAQDHTYITTPTEQETIMFTPNSSQSNVELVKSPADAVVEWKTVAKEQEDVLFPLTPLMNLLVKQQEARKIITKSELKHSVGTQINYVPVEFALQAEVPDNTNPDDVWVDLLGYPLEITVNGHKAMYRENDFLGPHYFVSDLNLAITFSGENLEHTMQIFGYLQTPEISAAGEEVYLTDIKTGSYEFNVSHIKNDGTVTGFTSFLTVTDEVQLDETKLGTTELQFGTLSKPNLHSAFNIPVAIAHDKNAASNDTTAEVGQATLYVNGQKIAEKNVTAAEQANVSFDDVAVTTGNHFKLGQNELLVTYSGTDTYNGSIASYLLEVEKATPIVSINDDLAAVYEFNYDGTGKALRVDRFAIVTVGGQTISKHEEKIYYKNTSLSNAAFTEELPVLPGVYETKIVVVEGDSYVEAEAVGPTITIKHVKPEIKVTGVVTDGSLTVTAQVSSTSNAIVPNGSIEFFVDGQSKATVNNVNGVATYTIDNSPGVSFEAIQTIEVMAKYVDGTIIDVQRGSLLYETAESVPQQFKVANSWVKVEGVAVDQDVIELNINEVAALNAIVNPTDASNPDVIWSIDNNQVATISQDGTVTALSEGFAYINVMTVDGGHEATAIVNVTKNVDPPTETEDGVSTPKPPTETGEVEPTPKPPTETGEVEPAPKPPTETGEVEPTPEPPTETGEVEPEPKPPTETGEVEPTPEPPTETGEVESAPKPPTETGEVEPAPKPPTETENGNPVPQPPSNGNEGVSNGSTNPDIGDNGNSNEEETTNTQNEFKVELQGLDEELKTKVDSLIITLTAESENEFILSLDGDKEDLAYVTDILLNKNGIFMTVDGKQIKITDQMPATNLDFAGLRVVRFTNNKMSPVMHATNNEGLRITSSNINDVFITAKVNEPFDDVAEDAWYQQYVEDMFNYGYTLGTTATTYSPNNAVTRAQFAAMIARALELSHQQATPSYSLNDIDGKWYANDVQLLMDAGIINGYGDGSFKGNNKLTRQQAAAMIERTLQYLGVNTAYKVDVHFKDYGKIADYAKNAVHFLAEKGVLISGEGVSFNPSNKLTRAQMAKILIQALQLSGKY